MLRREPGAGPPEAGHDFVENEEDPVLVAERPQTADEPIRRDDETGAADDRLEEDRRDVLGALVPQHLLDVCERLLGIVAEHRAVGVGVEEADHAGDAGLVRPAPVVAAERGGALRLAVERAPLGQDLVPLGVHARDPKGVLVRLAAARGEERLGQVARRDLGHQARELRPALLAE